MHGGTKGSGAPKGNQNTFKHGTYTRSAKAERAAINQLSRELKKLLAEDESGD
jgi:hypothetical protein